MANKTKKEKEEKKPARKGNAADKGIKERLDETKKPAPYTPNETQRAVSKYVEKRVGEMIEFRTNLKVEGRWREADEEYVPHELDFGTTRKRFETDQDTGLRSRMVPVGDVTQQWRQASSAPVLLAKIQTALSLIIDNMPEADLVSLSKKYQATSEVAYSMWKRNWSITGAKDKLKLAAFNQFKYGWVPQRTYPRKVKYPKSVLVEKDTDNPENDRYEEKEIVWFNDVDREPLNVYRTWLDEMTKPYDQYSMNECYYEVDYTYDSFKVEFGHYPESECVPRDSYMHRSEQETKTRLGGAVRDASNIESKMRKDVVTVGFFESRHKDLYVIYIPLHKIVVYASPLPNDDGYLSVTHTMYLLRNAKIPYGVSLWEIIRQNKALYDKMKNMTMDQLVLSIMKFGFYSGTNPNVGDGKMEIIPGQARQLTSSTGKPEVNWMEIPGPGDDSWKGLESIQAMMDDDSGITPTMEGEIQGKTLGETKLAEERALRRMKTPVENLAWLIEQDAYVSLSWMSQIYSIPQIMQFEDEDEMKKFEQEEQVEHYKVFQKEGADGEGQGPIEAHYLPQIALHLEGRDGKLEESKHSKFFQVGKDLMPNQMKWRGIFKVIPRSVMNSSQELLKALKMEIFNILVPILGNPPMMFAKAAKQLLAANEEDYKDWLPDQWVQYLDNPQAAQQMEQAAQQQGAQGAGGAQGGAPAGGAAPMPNGGGNAPVMAPGAPSMQAQGGTAPVAPAQKVVPGNQITPAKQSTSLFIKRK